MSKEIPKHIDQKMKVPFGRLRKQTSAASNLRELTDHVQATLAHHNISPIEELIKLYRDSDEHSDKIKVMIELASYAYPKLKSVDLQGNLDASIKINLIQFGEKQAQAALVENIENVAKKEPKLIPHIIDGVVTEVLEDEAD